VKVTNPEMDAQATAPLPTVPESALYPLHLGPPPSEGSESTPTRVDNIQPLKNYLRDQEQSYLTRALEQCSGDKEKAALLLGVSLATLYRKMSGEEKE
jgi:transcriptional regulator with PAS, ATPase and Fis domain